MAKKKILFKSFVGDTKHKTKNNDKKKNNRLAAIVKKKKKKKGENRKKQKFAPEEEEPELTLRKCVGFWRTKESERVTKAAEN